MQPVFAGRMEGPIYAQLVGIEVLGQKILVVHLSQ